MRTKQHGYVTMGMVKAPRKKREVAVRAQTYTAAVAKLAPRVIWQVATVWLFNKAHSHVSTCDNFTMVMFVENVERDHTEQITINWKNKKKKNTREKIKIK